jgi:diguanylate cyclase (GGDEF)-like protein/PAS domain S-box-containing protein
MTEQTHILLVNQDPDQRGALRGMLEMAGFGRVTEASDGIAAIRHLNNGTIDALVTDIPLGTLDGWRLARLVRSGLFQCPADIPILVVSRSYSEHIAEVTAKEYEINRFFPFEQRHRLPGSLRDALSGGGLPQRPSLLVIEDDTDIQRIVQRVLDRRFEIEAATDGHTGLEAWRARHHSLVLLDVMLPELSGPEVLKAILAEHPHQTVVIMTADGTPQRAAELVLGGAADFIAKPFRSEQLRRVCEIAARREDYMISNQQFAAQFLALSREKGRALVTLESIGDGVISTDRDSVIEYINPVAERLTGWTNVQARGRPLAEVYRVVNEFSHQDHPDPIQRCIAEGRALDLDSHGLLTHRSGSEIAIAESVAPIRDVVGEITGAVLVFHDVTEAHKLNRQLSYQASHDSLTGLINRSEFDRRLARALDDARKSGSEHVMCYLDLDQFKVVNDTSGHAAGDQLLQQVAVILQRQVRVSDTLARLGGDEFGILLEHCSIDKAYRVADETRKALQDYRFKWEDNLFAIGVSIGMVPVTAESAGLDDVLSTADAACYLAKEGGRNRIHVYHRDDGELVQRHGEMQWVSKVNQAFEENRFRLFAQRIMPVNDVEEGEHYELLIRIIDEGGALIAPGFFLPAVERYGLASTLDRWVIRNALEWLEGDPARHQRLHHCTINLSGKSLGDEYFHEFLDEQLSRTSVPAAKICFEITETAAITNLGKATDFMRRFKRRGCCFALDDFGSGMSSFAYLKALPVDYLKIDGVFVKDIVEDNVDHAMVRSINEVAQVIGLKTIAEFVESEDIFRALRAIGVDYAQGYWVAEPQPLDSLDLTVSPVRPAWSMADD